MSIFGLFRNLIALLAPTLLLGETMTLEQVLAEAQSRNLRLVAERFNISVAEARIVQARLKLNPVLSLAGNYLDILGSGFNPATNAAGPTEFDARVDYVLERGSKRKERVAVAAAARAVSELEVLNSTRSLILDVQAAFTEVLLAKENLTLASESLEAFQRIVGVNRTRVDAGDLARVELVRSEVAALQFRNQVRQAELRLRTAKFRLQALMGRIAFAPDFDVAGEMRREPLLLDRAEMLRTALAARPDLEALRRDQARSVADLRSQLAQGKVDFTLGAGFSRQFGVGGLRSGNAIGLFFAAPLPVFNRNEGEIERARQEQAQAEARIRSLEQEISAEAANAYEQFSTAKTLVETIEAEMLDQSRRVREVIEFSYRRGEATFVELLDAQRTLNDTIQGFNDARAEYAKSLYLIDAITGKGLSR